MSFGICRYLHDSQGASRPNFKYCTPSTGFRAEDECQYGEPRSSRCSSPRRRGLPIALFLVRQLDAALWLQE